MILSVQHGRNISADTDFFCEETRITVSRDEPLRILQLTDMQIIDLSCTRNPTRDRQIKGAYFKEGVPDMDERCFSYVKEVIEETRPDLIILTGDNVYGEFDDNGEMQKLLCRRMEEYGILWAPIFGNHDNESRMGVRWQMAEFAKCAHCLFREGTVTGHGNYALRISDGTCDLWTLYLLDSNGCKTVGNPHAPEEGVTEDNIDYALLEHREGIFADQIAWYKATAERISSEAGRIVPSLAFFHVPLHIYDEAIKEKYGKKVGEDVIADAPGDFGRIVEHNKHRIDRDFVFYQTAKSVGTVGFFTGHEHRNDAVIWYDGVCLAYGTKTGVATFYRDDAIGGTLITAASDGTFSVAQKQVQKRPLGN